MLAKRSTRIEAVSGGGTVAILLSNLQAIRTSANVKETANGTYIDIEASHRRVHVDDTTTYF